jgi:succinate-acetate transporter protein
MTVSPSGEQQARAELARRAEATTRVIVRPIGSPVALGFLGLAAASFVLAGLQVGWVEPAEGKKVALTLVLFAFPAQFVAGVLAFLARDGVVGSAMIGLGLIWLVVGVTLRTSPPASTSGALGLFLLFAAASLLASAAVSTGSKLVAAAILATAGLRFFLVGVYELGGGEGWEDAGGLVGLGLAFLALYAATASELEEAARRTIFPLGRRGEGKRVLTAETLVEQVENAKREPGVRPKL